MCDNGTQFDSLIATDQEDMILYTGIVEPGYNENYFLAFYSNDGDFQQNFTAYFNRRQCIELKKDLEDHINRLEKQEDQDKLLHLISSNEIFDYGWGNHAGFKQLDPALRLSSIILEEHRERLKNILKDKLEDEEYTSFKDFITSIEFWYDYEILGLDCK